MANITRRNEPQLPTQTRGYEWDPFRSMREMLRWDPFRELAAPVFGRERMEFAPDFEVKETGDSYVFRADLPGVKDSDLEVTLTGNRLSIGGKREAEQEQKGEKFYAYERTFGSFMRTFTLPEGIDAEHVRSELKDGVLTLVVPKKAEAKPKKITISASPTGQQKS